MSDDNRCLDTRAKERCRKPWGHAGPHDSGSGPWPDTFVDEVYEARCATCGLLSTYGLFDEARAAADAIECGSGRQGQQQAGHSGQQGSGTQHDGVLVVDACFQGRALKEFTDSGRRSPPANGGGRHQSASNPSRNSTMMSVSTTLISPALALKPKLARVSGVTARTGTCTM